MLILISLIIIFIISVILFILFLVLSSSFFFVLPSHTCACNPPPIHTKTNRRSNKKRFGFQMISLFRFCLS